MLKFWLIRVLIQFASVHEEVGYDVRWREGLNNKLDVSCHNMALHHNGDHACTIHFFDGLSIREDCKIRLSFFFSSPLIIANSPFAFWNCMPRSSITLSCLTLSMPKLISIQTTKIQTFQNHWKKGTTSSMHSVLKVAISAHFSDWHYNQLALIVWQHMPTRFILPQVSFDWLVNQQRNVQHIFFNF